VHYVIDYYYNPAGAANAPPARGDAVAPPELTTSIFVDVRPAVEDVSTAWDRLRRFPERAAAALRRPRFFAEGIDPASAPPPEKAAACAAGPDSGAAPGAAAPVAAAAAAPSPEEAKWAEMDAKCAPLLSALKAAPEAERAGRAVALNYCMGRVLCPAEAATYVREIEAGEAAGTRGSAGGAEEAAFSAMSSCLLAAGKRRRAPAAPLA